MLFAVAVNTDKAVLQLLGDNWLAGDLFEHIVTTSVKQIILSRYVFLRNLMFFLAALPCVAREPASKVTNIAGNFKAAVIGEPNQVNKLSSQDLNILSKEIVPRVSSRLVDFFGLYWASTRHTFADPLDSYVNWAFFEFFFSLILTRVVSVRKLI